jgi:hypothetical protein
MLVAGAIALAIGIGAGAIFASQQTGAAFAEDDDAEFEGIVEALPPTGTVGAWRIGGRTVWVTDRTEIDREGQVLAPGLRVEVEGVAQQDGSIVAEEIEVQEADDDDDGGPAIGNDDDDDTGDPAAPAPGHDDDGSPAVPLLPAGTAGAGHGDDDDD